MTTTTTIERRRRRRRRRDNAAAAEGAAASTREDEKTTKDHHRAYSSSPYSAGGGIRLLYFSYRFSTGSLVPFMSLYMQQHVGLDARTIGTLQAIRPVVTILAAPLWGGLADSGSGRRREVLILTFVGSFLCRMFASLLAGDVGYFALALCASSLFYAPVASLLDSIVVSSLSESDKREKFGRLRLWGELGNGLASIISLDLIHRGDRGFERVLLLHGASSVVALAFMLRCVPREGGPRPSPSQGAKTAAAPAPAARRRRISDWTEGPRAVLGDPRLLTAFALVAVAGYSMSLLENFCYINIRKMYAERESEMENAGRDIGLFRAFYSLGGTLTWYYSGVWIRAVGPDVVMLASVCCLPPCFFLYSGVGIGGGAASAGSGSVSAAAGPMGALAKVGFATAEAMRSGIFAALWNAATLRCNELAPAHVLSVMQTMLEATYRGVGHTSGSYLGGRLCGSMDISDAFVVVGRGLTSFLCAVGAAVYWMPRKDVLR